MAKQKFPVTGDHLFDIDGKMYEIKRQLRQKNGSPIDPEMVKIALDELQDVIEGKFKVKLVVENKIIETSHLRLISGGNNPKISACTGGLRTSLAYADEVFPGYLDSNLKNWKLDNNQPKTEEVEAEVWEMHAKDGTFKEIFNSFKTDTKNLKWSSQEQIEKFCFENRSWLRTDGCGTFFLFEEEVDKKKEFFVASVCFVDGGRLTLNIHRFVNDFVWFASRQLRLVVPAIWRLVS